MTVSAGASASELKKKMFKVLYSIWLGMIEMETVALTGQYGVMWRLYLVKVFGYFWAFLSVFE